MNPQVVGANLVVSIKGFYRDLTVVFFRIAFPVILILVFGTIFMERDNEIFDLDVQDLDRTNSSAQLAKAIGLSGRFKITQVSPAIKAAQYAKDHKRNLVLIIPQGLEASLRQRMGLDAPSGSVTLTEIHDPSSFGVTTKMQVLNLVLAGINQELSGKQPYLKSAETSILAKKYRFIEFFVPGIIAMAVMTASLFGAVNVNAELRQKGVIRKLSTTPITRTDWILSNVLYQFILAVLSTTVMLLVSYGVFSVSLEINAWLPVFVALDVFAFVGLGMILTRVAKEAESAAAAADALMFPMMFLSGDLLPGRDDAGIPAEVRQGPAALLCERGAPGLHGIGGPLGRAAIRRGHRDFRRRGLRSGHKDNHLERRSAMMLNARDKITRCLLSLAKTPLLFYPYYRTHLPLPAVILIENTNCCNAQCVMCPRETLTRKRGFMEFGLFEKIMKELSGASRKPVVHLHGFGEPLLDALLPERIKLAKTCGIKQTYIVTNASLLFPETARKIITCGIGHDEDQFLRHRRSIVSAPP